ncbi:Hypothetical protein, predicted transmembrane protein [Metamycoplasma auris 15026]|uniref:Uncharacterized protein n=1 Tax=Metamycoplasma auris 15026 TaxID=1188233 RepID=N9TQV4_9BACT|nr:hypothetical protein [Metamycoplasma auris]ENY68534.1 Hypothetical protein, predicted transmembrane protein [Metamycoplasma auris 15026]
MIDKKNIEQTKEETKKIKQKKTYFFLKDKTFIWTIIAFSMVFFSIIAFLDIKGLTSIYSYTFGLIFGLFSIAIFVFVFLLAIKNIFKMKNTYSASVFHFSFLRLGLLLFALMILGTSIYYAKLKPEAYTYKNALFVISQKWYEDFIANKEPLLPNKWTPGLFFSFIYFLIAFPGKTTGFVLSFIISIIFLLIACASFFISDNTFKKILNKKSNQEKHQTNINLNLDKQNVFEESKDDIYIEKNATNEQIKPEIEEDDFVSKTIENNEARKDEANLNKKNIQIIPDELDFSTQEFDLSFIKEENEEDLIPDEIAKQNEIEIQEEKEIETTDNNLNNIENNELDFFDETGKKEEKITNSKPTKFSIIEDKEDLF